MPKARTRAEIGGEFHSIDVPVGATIKLPTPNRLFSIATHAAIAAWRSLDHVPSRRFHVPDYFCREVVEAWNTARIPMAPFADDPRWSSPDVASLDAAPGDLVLAVNYFGARDGRPWSSWRAAHPDVLVIEDHSHDPVSAWARRSTADFAFASLRKTLPISDGAILWSPAGRRLPDAPDQEPSAGSAIKLAAMVMKREYLEGADVALGTFRALQLQGERDLLADPPAPLAPWNLPQVESGVPLAWRRRRQRNVREATAALHGLSTMRPMFDSWRRGHCPFNLILAFADEACRDACQAALIADRIYPPIHWAQSPDAPKRVTDLAATILTIPLDQRYGPGDVRRVVDALRAFDHEWTSQRRREKAASYSSVRGAR